MSEEAFNGGLIERVHLVNFGRHANLTIANLSRNRVIQIYGLPLCKVFKLH